MYFLQNALLYDYPLKRNTENTGNVKWNITQNNQFKEKKLH
jgi:hypothetical protein